MKPTSILGRYLIRQIVFNFLAVLLVILGIIFLFEMVERLRRIAGHPELNVWFAVQLAVARLPKSVTRIRSASGFLALNMAAARPGPIVWLDDGPCPILNISLIDFITHTN